MRSKFLSLMAGVLVLTQWACSGEGVRSPSPLSTAGPATPVELTGTWRGGSLNMGLVWHLSQEGEGIVGSSRITSSGGWNGEGRVTGTVAGSTFVFEETHKSGTLSIAECSAQVSGTLQVRSVAAPPTPHPERPGVTVPPISPPPTATMSGPVTVHACSGDFHTTIVLRKD
jgi:hypothetical protein